MKGEIKVNVIRVPNHPEKIDRFLEILASIDNQEKQNTANKLLL